MKPNMEYLPGYEELVVKRLPQMEPAQFQQWAVLLKKRQACAYLIIVFHF